jgi:glycosyltransferase involved in cell wall biosynthesis
VRENWSKRTAGQEPAAGRPEVARLRAALEGERQHSRALEREVEALRASWSWRLSAPLRALGRLLPAAARAAVIRSAGAGPAAGSEERRDEAVLPWSQPGESAAPRVLFLAHDTHRAGAQLLLLRLMRWLRQHSNIAPLVLAKDDGELLTDYQALAPVVFWPPQEQPDERRRLAAALRAANVALVYSNTLANGDVLAGLAPLGCPVLCHVHELGHWLRTRIEATDLAAVVAATQRYVAVSQAVSDWLQRELGVPATAIARIPGFASSPALSEAQRSARRRQVRDRLGIPGKSFVLGGCGTMDWRKAPELFVALARAVDRASPDAHLHAVWVGGADTGPQWEALRYDAERAGLGTRVHWVGNQPEVTDFYAAFDAFALTSREDPFPLVMLEAAAMRLPIVAFRDAGGSVEFVGDDAGAMVPYLDLAAMADAVRRLIEDPEGRRRLGAAAEARFLAGYEMEVVAPRILALMAEVAGAPLAVPRGPL